MKNLPAVIAIGLVTGIIGIESADAQIAPSTHEYDRYDADFKAIYDGDVATVRERLKNGMAPDKRDDRSRTPAHIAAYRSHDEILRLLVEAGTDINALEYMAYDVITIAAVANDVELLELALGLGGNAGNVTSPYDGTALIAAAHLGHDEVVRILLEAGAPVDHVNNLGWTALIEAVILGDGSARYAKTVKHLLAHGADPDIADRQGLTPLDHARRLGYSRLIPLLDR